MVEEIQENKKKKRKEGKKKKPLQIHAKAIQKGGKGQG